MIKNKRFLTLLTKALLFVCFFFIKHVNANINFVYDNPFDNINNPITQINYLPKALEANSSAISMAVAVAYSKGQLKDVSITKDILINRSIKNDIQAMYTFGLMASQDPDFNVSDEEIIKILEIPVYYKHDDAINMLANYYLLGSFKQKDISCLYQFRCTLANITDNSGKQNLQKALAYFSLANKHNSTTTNEDSLLVLNETTTGILGFLYQLSEKQSDQKTASHYYEKLCFNSLNPLNCQIYTSFNHTLFDLSIRAQTEANYDYAIQRLLEMAIKRGETNALAELGYYYLKTNDENNEHLGQRGITLINQGAQKNDATAYYYRGRLMENGFYGYQDEVVINPNEALALMNYYKAAILGNSRAQYKLYEWFSQHPDNFLKMNTNLALEYLRKAAEQNLKEAQYALGLEYSSGKNIEKNIAKARSLFELAKAQQDDYSHFELIKLDLKDGTTSVVQAIKDLETITFRQRNLYEAQLLLADLYIRRSLTQQHLLNAIETYDYLCHVKSTPVACDKYAKTLANHLALYATALVDIKITSKFNKIIENTKDSGTYYIQGKLNVSP